MDTLFETIDLTAEAGELGRGYAIQLHYDPHASNPREDYDSLGILCADDEYRGDKGAPEAGSDTADRIRDSWHPNGGYPLTDEDDRYAPWIDADHADAAAVDAMSDDQIIRSWLRAEHGAVAIVRERIVTGYSQGDNQDAWIYATAETLARIGVTEDDPKVREYLSGELETYAAWCRGDFCGWVLMRDGETVESVWGYEDPKWAADEAREAWKWDVADRLTRWQHAADIAAETARQVAATAGVGRVFWGVDSADMGQVVA